MREQKNASIYEAELHRPRWKTIVEREAMNQAAQVSGYIPQPYATSICQISDKLIFVVSVNRPLTPKDRNNLGGAAYRLRPTNTSENDRSIVISYSIINNETIVIGILGKLIKSSGRIRGGIQEADGSYYPADVSTFTEEDAAAIVPLVRKFLFIGCLYTGQVESIAVCSEHPAANNVRTFRRK